MDAINSLRELIQYGDAMNDLVLGRTCVLTEEQLERPLDLGPGSVRAICHHILSSERRWIARIDKGTEPAGNPMPADPVLIRQEFREIAATRRDVLARLTAAQLDERRTFHGGEATLHQMILNMFLHAMHHRSQLVNALRRVGADAPEIHYMSWVRQAVPPDSRSS